MSSFYGLKSTFCATSKVFFKLLDSGCCVCEFLHYHGNLLNLSYLKIQKHFSSTYLSEVPVEIINSRITIIVLCVFKCKWRKRETFFRFQLYFFVTFYGCSVCWFFIYGCWVTWATNLVQSCRLLLCCWVLENFC